MNGANSKAATPQPPLDCDMRRVCYFRMGSTNDAELQLDQVDGSLCSHLILDSARISPAGCLVLESSTSSATSSTNDHLLVQQHQHLKHLEAVREFKRRHGVKVMISVSNDDNDTSGFQRLANSAELRRTFAKSAVEFLQQFHLDGLDLSWKFPNFPTNFLIQRDQERTGLTKIVKALRSAMVENFYDRQQHELLASSSSSNNNNQQMMAVVGTSAHRRPQAAVEPHLLTVAIAGQESVLRSSYELKQLANLCDWLNVMSYDYFLFKAYAPFTGPNAPLHPVVDHFVPILNKLAFSWTATRLLDEGLDPEKIVMGIPTYARAYKLIFKNSTPAPFALSAGCKSTTGDNNHQSPDNNNNNNNNNNGDGCLNYGQVVEILGRDETRVEFDERARVPYLLTDGGYTWISYENPQSVREKVHYILGLGLGGYMTWSLNGDDHGAGAAAPGGHSNLQAGGQSANGSMPKDNEMKQVTFPLHRAMLAEVNSWQEAHCTRPK